MPAADLLPTPLAASVVLLALAVAVAVAVWIGRGLLSTEAVALRPARVIARRSPRAGRAP